MVTLVHSSDLHLSTELADGLLQLRRVLRGGDQAQADVVMLAGDTFEHVRQPRQFFEQAAELLGGAGRRVIILPGNHDPLLDGSDHWQLLAEQSNVSVLGVPDDEPARFEDLDLEIWGWAHRSYSSMSPLREPRERRTRWHVVMAHGHFSEQRYEPSVPAPSWLRYVEDIAATGADYIALGHWNLATKVGDGSVPAYYSGSPDLENTLNVIRLGDEGVLVSRAPLEGIPEEEGISSGVLHG
jgi:DNA repair exonuclease SbcCD nuclease subunit